MSEFEHISLPDNTIDLWIVRPQNISDLSLLAAYDELMNLEERQKQQKKRYAEDRHDALVTRALVRTVLSKYVEHSPQDWQFVKGDKGKPEILNPPIPLRFNISHTRDMIVCAVGLDADLGVDVEFIERNNSLLKIAEYKFAASEYDELSSHGEQTQRKRFFDYWTLKESYIKAVGGGLSIPLGDFHFTVAGDEDIQIAFEQKRKDDPALWYNRLMWGSSVHRIAISVKDPNKSNIRVFETIPLQDSWPVELPLDL